MKNKKLREAIENVGMINNIDEQNFDKDFKGVAPVSYADAVLRARAKRDAAKESCEEHRKVAKETLKKEISNDEHPEPIAKVKVNEEGKMILDEGLFESLTEERSDVSLAKNALDEIIERIHLGMSGLNELLDLDISDDARSKIDNAASDIAQVLDTLSLVARKYLKESFDDEHLGHGDDVCPKCGKEPCECNIDESVIRYPNEMEVTDIDLDKALDYQYGTDRDKDNSKYTDDEKQRAVTYWIKKTDPNPYDVSKEEVESLEESTEGVKVFRVTYKHSPEVFSSVMVKAANEDEAKQKLSVKKPGKDIVGVSVMSDDEVNDMTNRGMSLMEAKVVDDFSSYEPWEGAIDTFDAIQAADKLDELEQLIDDMYPDGIDKTELNDLLRFEADWVYSMLDMPNPNAEEDVEEEE